MDIILKIIGYFICWRASFYIWSNIKFSAVEYSKNEKEEPVKISKVGIFMRRNVTCIALASIPILRFWLLIAFWLHMLFFKPKEVPNNK